MSGSQLPAIFSKPHSLSEATSSIVCRIPELLRRLRDLENEEAGLDAKARQLMEPHPKTKDGPSAPSRPIISTPVSKLRSRATDKGTPSTPPHIDPSIYHFLGLEKIIEWIWQETSRHQ
jgi:hypothetical protein